MVDRFHGDKYEVADPYRWLEDNESEETKAFVTDQCELWEKLGASASDPQLKSKLVSSLRSAYNYEKFSNYVRRGEDLGFYTYNPGLLNQACVYSSHGYHSKLLLDPNTLRDDGTAA